MLRNVKLASYMPKDKENKTMKQPKAMIIAPYRPLHHRNYGGAGYTKRPL